MFVLASSNVFGQDVNSILEKYFDAIGGKEKVASLSSAQKKFFAFSLTGKKDTSLCITAERLPSSRHDETYSADQKTLIFEYFSNDKGGQNIFYHPFQMVVDNLAKKDVELSIHSAIYQSFLQNKLKLKKDRIIGGDTCYSMLNKIKYNGANTITYYIDKRTYLLKASSTDFTENNITFYEDYRETNGPSIPFIEEYYLNNNLITRTVYESVSFNDLPDNYSFKTESSKAQPQRDKTSTFNRIEFTDASLSDRAFNEYISQFKGKRILIDLWATWCAACKMEFKYYNDGFYTFLKSNEVEMVFISIDEHAKIKAWEKDIQWFNINGYHTLAGKNLTASIKKEIYRDGLMYIPRYILIDENGNIKSSDLGKPSAPNFRKDLARLLSGS